MCARRCVVAVLIAGGLAACSSRGGPTASSSVPASTGGSVTAPLSTSVATPSGIWATVPMGHLDDPANTFWEAFSLPGGADQWVERTPPDVADNGGLVSAPTPNGMVVGFRPSDELHFSPLASTTDSGATYSAGLLPAGLADVPDALSVAPGGHAAALTANEVLTSASTLSAWQPAATIAALAASPAGLACGIRQLTAVTATDTGAFIGVACSAPGVVGLLQQSGSTFHAVGPHLPAADVNDRIAVLRLVHDGQGIAALLGVTAGGATRYVAAWNSDPGSAAWTLSAALNAKGELTSTAVTSGSGFAVLTTSVSGALSAAVIGGAGADWAQLAAPPAGTATVSVSNSRTDALGVDGATFIDYRLVGANWIKIQTAQVAIPYGSSG
jgi:hypothetical protein